MSTSITISHRSGSSLAGRVQTFTVERLTCGRRPDNQVVFDAERDRAVSGHHAELTLVDGRLRLNDLGSQNGTWVNGARISGPVIVAPGDVVRLGEGGPEFTAAVGGQIAATMIGAPKTGIGAATLEKAITQASVSERQRSRTTLMAVTTVLLLVLTGSLIAYSNHASAKHEAIAEEQQKLVTTTGQLGKKVEAATAAAMAARQAADQDLKGAMTMYDQELTAMRGKLSDGEGRVGRLIVELQQRDQAVEDIRKRQDLTEAERAKMIAETEQKMAGLKDELKASEAKLREEAKLSAADWSSIAARYEECLFLVVSASKPNAQGQQSVGIGTAFVIREDGLLASNAHVVEPIIDAQAAGTLGLAFVIQNRTGRVFDLLDLIKHPQYGPVNSPDVGLLKVDLKGTKLTAMPLADEERLKKLRIGTHLGTMGYPGELMQSYLSALDLTKRESKTAIATFKDGWIGRITDFEDRAADYAASYWIQHSASTSGGTSGSPMFTSDGYVIAVNNSGIDYHVQVEQAAGTTAVRTPSASQIGHAVRADILREFVQSTGW